MARTGAEPRAPISDAQCSGSVQMRLDGRLCNAKKCRATTREVMVINAMQRVRCTPEKINKAIALSLSSVHAYQNKPVSIYISFYLLMDFILFMKVAFHA